MFYKVIDMKQYDAVEKISEAIINSNFCEGIFLKGSLARGTEDEFSNIDMYVIVKEKNQNKLLSKISDYLNHYYSIMFYTILNNSNVLCAFENGVRLDLNVITLNELSQVDDLAIVYDPNNILKDYKKVPLSYSPKEIGELINTICFTSLEFYSAYCRKDLIYSLRIASHINADLGAFVRIHFEPEYAKLGLKHYIDNIDQETKRKYMEIIKKLKYDTILESVKLMFVLLDSYVNYMPISLAEYLNLDFYLYTKKLIMSIVE